MREIITVNTGSVWCRVVAGAVALGFILGAGTAARAQETGSGSISGTVADESGLVVPGVVVTAVHLDTQRTATATTDSVGSYAITGLDAGRYAVQGMLPGFGSPTATVEVTADAAGRLDLVLAIAPFSDTVIVTRSEQDLSLVPQSVAVVQRNQIEHSQRRASLDEALRGIPGLFVQNRRNYGLSGGIGLSIRAPQPRFGLRGLAIIQDGIPITTADGTTEPGNIDLGSVGRIEVVRGPSSVLYGNSAGGVISLNTTFDTSRALTITPDIQFGNHGYNRQQVRLDGGNDSTQFMASVSRSQRTAFARTALPRLPRPTRWSATCCPTRPRSAACSTCMTPRLPRAPASSTKPMRAPIP